MVKAGFGSLEEKSRSCILQHTAGSAGGLLLLLLLDVDLGARLQTKKNLSLVGDIKLGL